MITHNCDVEYWSHCLGCVLGEDNFDVEILSGDGLSVPFDTQVRVYLENGEIVNLVREFNGWKIVK